MITVYGITDPFGQIRYVGQTANPLKRFRSHRSTQKSFEVTGLAVLAVREEWEEAAIDEAKWIAFFGLDNLLNRWEGCHIPGSSDKQDDELQEEPMVIPSVNCKECRTKFQPARDWQIFCSEVCRESWYRKAYRTWKEFRKKKLATK